MPDVVVNGRFLDRPITGVERYAGEIMRRLDGRIRVCRPPDGATGARGHLWEQMWLPRLVDGALLWSPANTGPMVVSRQVVTVHAQRLCIGARTQRYSSVVSPGVVSRR